MKIFIVIITLIVMSGCAATAHEVKRPEPAWLKKTIIPEGEFIYSIGHSRPKETEQEAREDALVEATEEFIRYCRVDVNSFTRSVEVYSKRGGKEFGSEDFETQASLRARAFVSKAVPEDWHIRKDGRRYKASVLLKVPRSEFDRILTEKDIKLSLDVFFHYEDEQGRMQVMTEGSVLKSGDGYAIYVKPSDSCYLYVYQVDALGKSFRLFPNSDFQTGANPLSPASDLWIPNNKDLFKLDETTGKEYFHIFASPDRIVEFEREGAVNLQKRDIAGVISIKKMGVAGLTAKRDAEKVVAPKGRQAGEVKKKLQAEGAFVYETWFWHR